MKKLLELRRRMESGESTKPDKERADALRRLEALEARAATLDIRVRVATGNGDDEPR